MSCVDHNKVMMLKSVQKLDTEDKKLGVQEFRCKREEDFTSTLKLDYIDQILAICIHDHMSCSQIWIEGCSQCDYHKQEQILCIKCPWIMDEPVMPMLMQSSVLGEQCH